MCETTCTEDYLHTVMEEPFDWDDEANVDRTDGCYEAWKAKREADIKHCMMVHRCENPRTGRSTFYSKLCGEPGCSICGPQIREEMYKALSKHNGSLRLVKLAGNDIKQERAKIARRYGKNNISVFANDVLTERGLATELEILIKTDDEVGDVYDEVKWEDVERWSQKSYYCKKSGNLHKTTKTVVCMGESNDPLEDAEQVKCEEWVLDTRDEKKLEEIEMEVLKETQDLDPQTFDELEAALKVRREVWKRKLKEKKIVILSNTTKYITVRMIEVDWKLSRNKQKPA